MAELAEAIGLEKLEEIQTEVPVGDFSLDILAREVGSETIVAVENQFNRGDHGHLGQLITYAAGISGRESSRQVFVWIVESLRDEHRSALEWLNRNTSENIGFFGIELEVWRVIESDSRKSSPALRFNVVCRPNEFEREAVQTTSTPSATGLLYLEFWRGLKDYCERANSTIRFHAPGSRHWQTSSIGRAGFGVNFTASATKKFMATELYIEHVAAHQALSLLQADQSLRAALGPDVEFQKLKKHARIIRKSTCDVNDRSTWESCFDWLRRNGEAFKLAFQARVRALDLGVGTDTEEG
jgi:hypothetical protein